MGPPTGPAPDAPPGEAAPIEVPGFDLELPPDPGGEQEDDGLPPPAAGVIDLDEEPDEGPKKDDKSAEGIDDWTLDVDDSQK